MPTQYTVMLTSISISFTYLLQFKHVSPLSRNHFLPTPLHRTNDNSVFHNKKEVTHACCQISQIDCKSSSGCYGCNKIRVGTLEYRRYSLHEIVKLFFCHTLPGALAPFPSLLAAPLNSARGMGASTFWNLSGPSHNRQYRESVQWKSPSVDIDVDINRVYRVDIMQQNENWVTNEAHSVQLSWVERSEHSDNSTQLNWKCSELQQLTNQLGWVDSGCKEYS